MQLKQAVLFPIRKSFTFPVFSAMLAGWLKKSPTSRILRGVCPNHSFFSRSAVRTVNRKGVNFELRLNDYMDWLLYFHSDADSSAPVLEFIRLNNIVLDIGGNIGQTALFMAQKVGPGGKVISFEPFPETYNRFLTNLKLNPGINNLVIENIALGDRHEKLMMRAENSGNSGQNRLMEGSADKDALLEVSVMPLSSYLAAKPLRVIDLIKIDVEGFEYRVLQGAKSVLQQYKPLLYIELSNKNLEQQGSSANEVIRLLRELAYTVTDMSTGKEITQLSSGHTDVICRPAG